MVISSVARLVVGLHDFVLDSFYAISTRDIDSEPGSHPDSFECLATPYWILFKLFSRLLLRNNDVVIDFGCGTGRVVCFAARYKLSKVYGVEYNSLWAQKAKENSRRLRVRRTEIEIHHGDAATFEIREGTIFFFFNPFGGPTLHGVLNNIRDSIEANPREIQLIAFNPVCMEAIEQESWLIRKRILLRRRGSGVASAVLFGTATK